MLPVVSCPKQTVLTAGAEFASIENLKSQMYSYKTQHRMNASERMYSAVFLHPPINNSIIVL